MLLDKLRSTLSLDVVAITDDGTPIATAGHADELERVDIEHIELPDQRSLVYAPPISDPDDRLIVRAFADQLATALRRSELAAAETHARTLAEIDQFRTALLRAVSHDLRTPLAAIKAAASSLEQDDVDWPDHARREFVATIVEEGDRLDRIITNLLDASRLEAGVLSVQVTTLDPTDVLERAAHTAPPGVDVTLEIPPESPPIRADRALLERVLENLLVNAARYAPGPVQLSVDHDSDAGASRIRVVDHGPGVPAEMYDALFRGFQRLDDRGAGVGLGLAVSHGFVEAMGGLLEASETPGGGLTMDIVLPSEERHG